MSFENCVNDGTVTGSQGVGGFVGQVEDNTNMDMTISNSTSNGDVTGSDVVGGFVGWIGRNTNMTMTISNSTNNGNVIGGGNVGGFVGFIVGNTNMTMTISNSVNNGDVTGSSFVGGFVGEVYSFSWSLFIINSANRGGVQAKSGMACGVFCVDPEYNINVNTTILNSINKGSVNARTNVYGITNNITKARNMVSMGDVTSSSGSYSFWNTSTDVDLFFGLKSKCKNCGANATLFEHNTNTRFYEVVESHKLVHELLNDEAVSQHFGMVWTSELELVDKVNLTVNVSGLLEASFEVESGSRLNEVKALDSFWKEEYGFVGWGNQKE